MPSKSKKQVEQDRIREAIEYRMMGHSYAAIAEAMSEETKTEIAEEQVVAWVARGLAAIHREPTVEQVILDLQRVDVMLAKQFENASAGDSQASSIVLQLMKRKEELEAKLVPAKPKEAGLFDGIKGDDKGGRPQHVPTEKTRTQVEAFVLAGLPLKRIAECIGIHSDTLKKHYGDLLEAGKDVVKAEAAGTLVSHWRRGNLSALIFYLKTQCGYKETQGVEHAGPDGAPLPAFNPLNLPMVNFIFSDEALPNNTAGNNGAPT